MPWVVIDIDNDFCITGLKNIGIQKLRTDEEHDHLLFPFAMHIPIHELPDRMDEVPHDKFVITFCVSGFRAIMGYVYLRTHGYVEIKALKGRLDQLAGAITADRIYPLTN